MYAPDLVADVILRVRERPAWRGSREGLFRQLVAELARHEVAEEEILRPVSRRDAGDSIADARIREEADAEELLKEMERLDPASAEFGARLSKLRTEVERHARAEETEEFPKVQQKEPLARLEQMGRAYQAAKELAPTHPHPSTPNTPTANILVGPFAAVLDRARDAVRSVMSKAAD
jgi:iron-sulfur cluster repair protein YtfE (RIC family)